MLSGCDIYTGSGKIRNKRWKMIETAPVSYHNGDSVDVYNLCAVTYHFVLRYNLQICTLKIGPMLPFKNLFLTTFHCAERQIKRYVVSFLMTSFCGKVILSSFFRSTFLYKRFFLRRSNMGGLLPTLFPAAIVTEIPLPEIKGASV